MSDNRVSIHRADPKKADLTAARWRVPSEKYRYPTPEQPLIISASELDTFLRCRTKWWWQYQCRLEPAGGPTDPALAIGDLTHQILERWYKAPVERRTLKRMQALAPKICHRYTEKQLSPEDRKLAEAMAIGYAAWVLDPKNPDNDRAIGLKKCYAEWFFELPLVEDGSILVRGKVDVVFPSTKQKSTLGFREHKTRKDLGNEDVEIMVQNTVYHWALRQSKEFGGYKYYIGYFDRLRKQLPTPRVRAPLFDSQPFERSDEEIEQWRQDTVKQALDMLDAAIYPTPTKSCAWECSFREPCIRRGDKDNLVHILTNSYRRRP